MALTSIIYFFAKHVTMVHALTFGGVVQTTRLFGGQLGSTPIPVTQRISERTHSNLLGQHVTLFDPEAVDRLRVLGTITARALQDITNGGSPAKLAMVDEPVRIQSITLPLSDVHRIAALCAVGGIILALTLRKPRRNKDAVLEE